MGTNSTQTGIAETLFGKTRRQILALLFCNPERDYYLREIVRSVGVGRGSVERELKRLTDSGLVTRQRKGRQVHYQANQSSSVFPELKALMTKTAGVADVVRSALEELRGAIEVAAIFGSWAKGTGQADSDVDLLVIGGANFEDLAIAASRAQERLGREVNPVVYSTAEFREKLAARHDFVSKVASEPKIYLIGDEHDLTRLGA